MPVEFTERFVRQYTKLPVAIRNKIDKALKLLDNDFRHPGLRSHPVEKAPGIFEAYVDDKYRMTYEHKEETFILRNVDNHDECLKNP
jgi:mRNA-degrading endonuclease RelE of RelBE toxin-antitoxin system